MFLLIVREISSSFKFRVYECLNRTKTSTWLPHCRSLPICLMWQQHSYKFVNLTAHGTQLVHSLHGRQLWVHLDCQIHKANVTNLKRHTGASPNKTIYSLSVVHFILPSFFQLLSFRVYYCVLSGFSIIRLCSLKVFLLCHLLTASHSMPHLISVVLSCKTRRRTTSYKIYSPACVSMCPACVRRCPRVFACVPHVSHMCVILCLYDSTHYLQWVLCESYQYWMCHW